MKIITAFTDKYDSIIKVTSPRLKSFCENHGFTYNCEKLAEMCERPHSWYKIEMCINEIENNDYLLWIDADAIILKTEFNPYLLFEDNKDFYISKDFNGINFGVFIIRCNEYTKKIFKEIWDRTEFLTHPNWEQAAFIQLVSENFLDINSKIKYVSQKILNAYEHKHFGRVYPEGEVCDETFIFHTPSLPMSTREELIKKYDKLRIY